MKRIGVLIAALALLCCAATADAVGPFYVKRGGSTLNSGLSETAAWPTIAYANATLPVPDGETITVYVGTGSWTSDAFPAPTSVPINGGRFAFVPLGFAGTFAGISYDSTTTLAGGKMNKTYLTIRGFKIQGGVEIGGGADADTNAFRDSLSHNLVLGGLTERGSSYCVASFNLFRSSNSAISINNSVGSPQRLTRSTGLTFAYNICAPLFGSNLANGARFIIGGRKDGGEGPTQYNFIDSLLVERNQFNFIIPSNPPPGTPGGGEPDALSIYYLWRSTFQYNVWEIDKLGDEYHTMLKLRTNSNAVTFNGERFYARGPGNAHFRFSQAGDGWSQTRNITIDSTWVLTDQGTACHLTSGMRFYTITRSVFSSGGSQAFTVGDSVVGANTITHDTFSSGALLGGVASLADVETRWDAASVTTMKDNIYAHTSALPPTPDADCGTGGHWNAVPPLVMPNKAHSIWGLTVLSDNNLFQNKRYKSTHGDRSVYWAAECSGIGNNSAWDNTTDLVVRDTLSKAGGAEFSLGTDPDSLAGARFDPRIGARSLAIGMGTSASDAGAIAYVGVPDIFVETPGLQFLDMAPGETRSLTFTITNRGTADLSITGITSSTSQVTPSPTTATITAAASEIITVQYTKPSGVSDVTSATLLIASNDPNRPLVGLVVTLDPMLAEGEANPN